MKVKAIIQKIPLMLVLLGIIILFIGLYYVIIKAGIPYQDPTPELLQKYNNYTHTGHVFIKISMAMELISGLYILARKCSKRIVNRWKH